MLNKFIFALENPKIPFKNCLLTFLFALALRSVAESYSQINSYFSTILPPYITGLTVYDVIHFDLSYVVLALMFICFLHFVTHESIEKVARVILPSFIVLLVAPLLDLFVTKGRGANIYYLDSHSHVSVLQTYLTYSSHFNGMSFGIRCELLLIFAGCFLYFRTKGINLFLSLFYTWFCYSIIFAQGSSPYCVQTIVELFGFHYIFSSISMVHFYLVEIFAMLILLTYMINKEIVKLLAKNIFKFIHWPLALLLGCFLGFTNSAEPILNQIYATDTILINILLSMICIFLVWVFAFLNQQESNQNYKAYAYFAFAASALCSTLINLKAFMMITMLMGCHYIYNEPPLSVKNIPIVSKLLISMNSMALIILGFLIVQGGIDFFPNQYFWIILGGGTLAQYLIIHAPKRFVMSLYNIGITTIISYLWISKLMT